MGPLVPSFHSATASKSWLTSAVTDAIQMARIEAGQIELRKGPRSVADLVRQSLSKLAGSLDADRRAWRFTLGDTDFF